MGLKDQVTAVFVVPLTVGVDCCVLPPCSVTDVGVMVMETDVGGGVDVEAASEMVE